MFEKMKFIDCLTVLLSSLTLVTNSIGDVKKLDISGLVAAVFSPLDDNYDLNVSVVPEQAKFLNETGVSWVFVSGTTGESILLTISEREKLLQAWVDIAPTYGISVIAHVGASSLEDSRTLATYAATFDSNIVRAIGCMPQTFFKISTVTALAITMKYVSDAAPSLPFYYYHIPSMDYVTYSMLDFIIASESIEFNNLVGIKYTGLYQSPSFVDILKIYEYDINNKYEILTGRDEMMIECLITGVKGFVGSQYNFAGQLYNKIINTFNSNITEKNDGCKDKNDIMSTLINLQTASINLIDVQTNNVSSTTNGAKYLMNLAGVKVGDARYPFLSITDTDQNFIQNNIAKWCNQNDDLLDWCKSL